MNTEMIPSEEKAVLWIMTSLSMVKESIISETVFDENAFIQEASSDIDGEIVEIIPGSYYEKMIQEKNEEFQSAIEEHIKKLESAPDSLTAKHALAELYFRNQDFNEAAKYCADIAAQKNDTWSYYNLGTIHLKSGNKDKAREFLNKALELAPDNIVARYNLGCSYIEDDPNKATKEFQELVKNRDDGSLIISYAHNNLGILHYTTISDKTQAIKFASDEFDKAGDVGIHNAIIMLKESMGLTIEEGQAEDSDISELIGRSGKIEELKKSIQKAASSDFAVIIQGETGSGKEIVGRAIHKCSNRKDAKMEGEDAFIAINCAELDPETMRVELFGSIKGAFTGAENRAGAFKTYSEGTIFLDEISKLSRECQTQLLRVLSSKDIRRVGGTKSETTNARIIAADSRNLEEAAELGEFSNELLGRLDVIKIQVPPLRERLEDVPILINYFLNKYTPDGKTRKAISDTTMSALKQYEWKKYNVRELENEVKRLIAMVDENVIYPRHLKKEILDKLGSKEDLEKELIKSTLQETGGNVSEAGRLLEPRGIDRNKINRLIKKHSINPNDYRPTK